MEIANSIKDEEHLGRFYALRALVKVETSFAVMHGVAVKIGEIFRVAPALDGLLDVFSEQFLVVTPAAPPNQHCVT